MKVVHSDTHLNHSDTIFDPIDAFVSNYKSGTNFTAPLVIFRIRQRFLYTCRRNSDMKLIRSDTIWIHSDTI